MSAPITPHHGALAGRGSTQQAAAFTWAPGGTAALRRCHLHPVTSRHHGQDPQTGLRDCCCRGDKRGCGEKPGGEVGARGKGVPPRGSLLGWWLRRVWGQTWGWGRGWVESSSPPTEVGGHAALGKREQGDSQVTTCCPGQPLSFPEGQGCAGPQKHWDESSSLVFPRERKATESSVVHAGLQALWPE